MGMVNKDCIKPKKLKLKRFTNEHDVINMCGYCLTLHNLELDMNRKMYSRPFHTEPRKSLESLVTTLEIIIRATAKTFLF